MTRKSIPMPRISVSQDYLQEYYTDSHGADLDAHRRALSVLLDLASKHQRECAIAVGIRTVIGPKSALDNVLPEGAARSLSRGAVQLNEIMVHLITKRITPTKFGRGPVLALYVDPKHLGSFFEEGRITELIYVPWTDAQRERFLLSRPEAKVIYP